MPHAHGTPTDARAIFSQAHTQQLLMKLEAALALAQARQGTVPQEAADEINRTACVAHVATELVEAERRRVGHPMVALINAWSHVLGGDAAQWLHYGATTQDIFDTVQLLQLRAANTNLMAHMRDAEAALMRLAQEYRATPMIGRTVGRHALPITFGLKVAGWLAENRRSIERLKAWAKRSDTGILSGAVGSYAALGEDAFNLETQVLRDFGVGAPLCADWKGSRDMHAEFGAILSIVAYTWRKIAQEFFLLQGDDIRELDDPGNAIGSSTMPHKTNPGSSRAVIALARRIPHHAAVLLDWMVSIHERDQISSADTLAELAIDAEHMLTAAVRMVSGVVVLPANMLRNMGRTNGQIMAEPAMFALGRHIGKKNAHTVVWRAAADARQKGVTLIAALRDQPELKALQETLNLDALLEPAHYLGLAPEVVDRTLEEIKCQRVAEQSDMFDHNS